MLDFLLSAHIAPLKHFIHESVWSSSGASPLKCPIYKSWRCFDEERENKREIQKKMQDQEEEELDSLGIATQIIPIANTPRSNNNKRKDTKVVPPNL